MDMRAQDGYLCIGGLELDIIMLPSGQIAVAAVQIGDLYFPTSPTNYNKEIKNALGEDFEFHKVYTTIAQRMVNYLTMAEFRNLTAILALRGNKTAKRFVKVFW